MTNKAELACVYSALILADDDVAVTVSNLQPLQFAPNFYFYLAQLQRDRAFFFNSSTNLPFRAASHANTAIFLS
jgi:hypothetical protein